MAAKLRAVKPDEPAPAASAAPSKAIKSVEDAATRGTRMDELVQMRLVIARALDNPNTSARDLAALSRRQMEISREIESLERQAKEEAADGGISEDEAWSEEAI